MRNRFDYLCGLVWLTALASCGFQRPADLPSDAGPADGSDQPAGPSYVLTIAKTGDSGGRITATVAGAPADLDCGSACSESFTVGAIVQLHAEPDAGGSFVGWSGGCSGGADCTVTILTALTVTADFRTNDCTPNTTVCSGNATVACDATGHPTFTDCRAEGCWDSTTNTAGATGDSCADMDASNGLGSYLDMAATAASHEFADGTTIDTDSGVIASGGSLVTLPTFSIMQTGTEAKIRVLVVKDLTLRNTVVTGSQALAIVADGAINVLGEVDATANLNHGGPGASSDPSRCTAQSGTGGAAGGMGAGGGSYGARGGNGGGYGAASGPVAGAIIDTDLSPLIGGCAGGDANTNANAYGGRGGGAIQLVSRLSITVAVSGSNIGRLNVGGGGGAPDNGNTEGSYGGGGGGGSGGGVLLEAPDVVLAGAQALVSANGGGGGSGEPCGRDTGANGAASTIPAAGGLACNTRFPGGGNGAAGSVAAQTAPAINTSDNGASGGGGGGLGYLVVRNATGQFSAQTGAAVSATLKQLPLLKRARL